VVVLEVIEERTRLVCSLVVKTYTHVSEGFYEAAIEPDRRLGGEEHPHRFVIAILQLLMFSEPESGGTMAAVDRSNAVLNMRRPRGWLVTYVRSLLFDPGSSAEKTCSSLL
jgi:hypothetical protein